MWFHPQSSLLDYPPLPLPHSAPSLLFPSHGDIHCDPRLERQFGRFAEQSLLTSYEPNDPVEVNSTEVSLCSYHQEQRVLGRLTIQARTSLLPASSEVDEIQSMGMLASPLFTQKREASATSSRIYQPKLRRCTRIQESRAEIYKVYRSLIPREKRYSLAIEMFRIF